MQRVLALVVTVVLNILNEGDAVDRRPLLV